MYAGTKKSAVSEVKKIILEEFGKIDEMNEKNLEEAKQRVIGLRKVSSEESSGVMNQLMFSELADKAESYYEHDEKIRKVKLEDVKKMAAEITKKYSTVAIVPK